MRQKIQTKGAKAEVISLKWDLVLKQLVSAHAKDSSDEELGLFIQKVMKVKPEVKSAVFKKFMSRVTLKHSAAMYQWRYHFCESTDKE
jgi:hypothetical protein